MTEDTEHYMAIISREGRERMKFWRRGTVDEEEVMFFLSKDFIKNHLIGNVTFIVQMKRVTSKLSFLRLC